MRKQPVTIRLPPQLHDKVKQIAVCMKMEEYSILYRWIVEGFIEAVESTDDSPSAYPVLDLARKLHQKKKKNAPGRNRPEASKD